MDSVGPQAKPDDRATSELKPDGRKVKGSRVIVPEHLARLVKMASNYLEIHPAEYVANAIRYYTDSINLFEKMATTTRADWQNGEVARPEQFKRYSKRTS